MHHCPNCETEVLTKEETHYKTKPPTKHRHANHLDLENCPECGFNFDTREIMVVEDKNRVKLNITPPKGSKLDSFRYSNSILEITSPREGFSQKVRGPLFFGIIWLAFVALWTLLAIGGGPFMVLFSIPFWMSGLSMIYSVSKSIFEEQKFELNGRILKIEKNRLLNSNDEEIDLAFIQSVKLESVSPKGRISNMSNTKNVFGGKRSKVPTITLKDGTKHTMLENGSQAEQIWMVSLLNDYMRDVAGKDYMN